MPRGNKVPKVVMCHGLPTIHDSRLYIGVHSSNLKYLPYKVHNCQEARQHTVKLLHLKPLAHFHDLTATPLCFNNLQHTS
jgi:hypothetical protein